MSTTTQTVLASAALSCLAYPNQAAAATPTQHRSIPVQRGKSAKEMMKLVAGDRLRATTTTTSTTHSLPLQSYHEGWWRGKVAVGTPPQEFEMLFDTGSNDFVIADSTCSVHDCGSHKRFDSSKSSTYVSLAKRTFGDCYGAFINTTTQECIEGHAGLDTITIAGISQPHHPIAQITNASIPKDQIHWSGIVGLGPGGPFTAGTPFELFGILSPPHDGVDGMLDIGAPNPAHYTGDFVDVPMVEGDFLASVMSFAAGGQTLWTASKTDAKDRYTPLIDSGFGPVMALPEAAITGYAKLVGAQRASGAVFYEAPCAQLVDLEITFEGPSSPSLTLSKHIFGTPTEEDASQCQLALIMNFLSPGDEYSIFGDAFLRGFYAVYDTKNQRFRFAAPKY